MSVTKSTDMAQHEEEAICVPIPLDDVACC